MYECILIFPTQLTEKQSAEISELQQKVNDLEMDGASSFALQSAMGTLKEKLRKTQAELRLKDAELRNVLTGSRLNAADEVWYQLEFVLCFWPLCYFYFRNARNHFGYSSLEVKLSFDLVPIVPNSRNLAMSIVCDGTLICSHW